MTYESDSIDKKRQRYDKWSRYTVTAFGGLVLITLVVLISHLLTQSLPLALLPKIQLEKTYGLPDKHPIVANGDIFSGQPMIVKNGPCRLALMNVDNRETFLSLHNFTRPCDHELAAISLMGENALVDISSSGQVRIVFARGLTYGSRIQGASRSNQQEQSDRRLAATSPSSVSFSLPVQVWQNRKRWHVELSSRWAVAKVVTDEAVFVRWVNRKDPTLRIDKQFEDAQDVVLLPGAEMMIVEQNNELTLMSLNGPPQPLGDVGDSGMSIPLSKRVFALEKDRTFLLIEGETNSESSVSRWVLQRDERGLTFKKTYSIALGKQVRVLDVGEHASGNVLILLTNQSSLLFVNRVSGEIVSQQSIAHQVSHITWFGDRIFGYDNNQLYIWRADHLSGITTWRSLFSPLHYEGYSEPDTVWQTTSASDFTEAKFSLTPLLIGSIKASLLALILAIPLAIGAAIYTAFFAKSRLRHIIKPAVEMLEAVPSVLIGFIAAIWLSPKAEQFLFSFAFFLMVVPFVLVGIALVQREVAGYLPSKIRHGAELGFAIFGVFVLGFVSVEWAPFWLESLFGVNGYEILAAESDSPIGKTTIVVAIALGVAISPSIYSLAEDAISGVPDELKFASFALGATRLQTLMYVVLKVAFPGVVAAIMLGFGRAFGETMIVLMVTGNTPISSWGLIEGLRALTANLAIELPEADVSSAHYQILFLTAAILFAFTFIVNTVAELVRKRMRLKG